MKKLASQDLWSLEDYAKVRDEFRQAVIDHKKNRQLAVGPNATLYFEDGMTIKYQVQEMLRIERIFEQDAIAEELTAYNPLIPDGHDWKATLMIEFADQTERRAALARMRGIEDTIRMQVDGCDPIEAFANEDIERSNADKTSAVHFLRFELDDAMIAALRGGAGLSAGITHAAYDHTVRVPPPILASLIGDLDAGDTLE